MHEPPIDAVIFDLGGVLASFGGVGPMRDLAGVDSDDEVWRRWLTCRWVRRFERGACSPEDFAAGVVSDWALPITPEAFLDGFRTWLAGPFPGAEDLVRAVRKRVPVGCLSNTNSVHWDKSVSQWALVDLFDFRFLSFQLGLLKPDREVFDYVTRAVDTEPERLLVLDDNPLNVEGARSAGFQAAQVRGIEEAKKALVEAGVL